MVNGTGGDTGSARKFLLSYVVLFAVVDEGFRHFDRWQKGREIFVCQAEFFSFFI